jgi:hypothetical protein
MGAADQWMRADFQVGDGPLIDWNGQRKGV